MGRRTFVALSTNPLATGICSPSASRMVFLSARGIRVTLNLCEVQCRVQTTRLFFDVSPAERDVLLQLSICEEFAAGEVLVRQEMMTRNLWIVLDGQCEVIKLPPIGELGTPVALARLRPPEVFGEMTLISSEPHVASVEARTAVQTLRLRGADFDALIETQPRLACHLLRNLLHIQGERLRAIDEKLSRQLDRHEALEEGENWKDLQLRLGRLYS